MATELVKENINTFLLGFLSRPASAIAKGAQWVVTFETRKKPLKDTIFPAIRLAYTYEPNTWNTEDSASKILEEFYQKDRGCLFCQAIGLPGESMNANVEGNIVSNAFIRSYVGAGRNDFPIMRMTFLDTNISFSDSFLRGWALATANFGMIARSDDDVRNYRTDIMCYKFAITPDGPFIIQTMTFKDACCIGVSEEEYQYTPATSPVLREARFVYNSYSIDTVSGNDPKIKDNVLDIQKATAVAMKYQPGFDVTEPKKPKPELPVQNLTEDEKQKLIQEMNVNAGQSTSMSQGFGLGTLPTFP